MVLGSAIRTGKLLPEALAFLEENQERLTEIPFSVFIVCWTIKDTNPESVKIVNGYLAPVRELVELAHAGMFPGVLDLSKLNWKERLLMRFMKVQPGDFRRWDAIDSWAEDPTRLA